MGERKSGKLNQLEKKLPEGLLVDAAWLEARGYYGSLRKKYVDHGWLEQPAHRVYRRPRGDLSWEQAVISLQTLLAFPVVVGGYTALEVEGYAHYVAPEVREVHLYGASPPPTWLGNLSLPLKFRFHRSDRLFPRDPEGRGVAKLEPASLPKSSALKDADLTVRPWGHWNWPLVLSAPERAYFELLDELPSRQSFDHADKIMEGLLTLRPARVQKLLEECGSVKVKRLFLFFADRHRHPWLKYLDRARIDLGKGKRMLVRGGRFEPEYGITVPEDLYAVQ